MAALVVDPDSSVASAAALLRVVLESLGFALQPVPSFLAGSCLCWKVE